MSDQKKEALLARSLYHTHMTQFLDETVKAYPERTAVIDGDKKLSFKALQKTALKLADAIAASVGERTKLVVAVFVQKGIDSVVADTGVLYSSNAFLNLDIKHPEQRFRNIFESVKPDLIITRRDVSERIQGAAGEIPILYMDDIYGHDDVSQERKDELLLRRDRCLDIDLMCIVNTSGSTGTPKSVPHTHRGYIDIVSAEVRAGLLDEKLEIAASLVPMVFVRHMFELALMMMRGATLLIVPEHLAAFPARMLEYVAANGATYLFWTPTIMVNIANMDLLSELPLPDLRKVWFAGEIFPTAKFNYWRRHLPNVQFVNLYGPTEITGNCTYYVVDREIKDKDPIPIGQVMPNTEVLLLDEDGHEVPQGVEGEICVRGICIAQDYYNNSTDSMSVFVQTPIHNSYRDRVYRTGDMGVLNSNNEIIFKGRQDTLIKHLGYRVELAEIENVVIATVHTIKNCCVLYNIKSSHIALFYEANYEQTPKDLRKEIGKVLPHYMVPTSFIYLAELPRNSNGKIDRALLKQHLSQM